MSKPLARLLHDSEIIESHAYFQEVEQSGHALLEIIKQKCRSSLVDWSIQQETWDDRGQLDGNYRDE